MLVRAGDERDLANLARCTPRARQTRRSRFDATRSLVHYALTKKRLLAGLGPPGLRQLEFFVAEEGASAVAYVVLSRERQRMDARGSRRPRSGWRATRRDAAGAGRARAVSATPLIRAWWPRAFPVPPQIRWRPIRCARHLHGAAARRCRRCRRAPMTSSIGTAITFDRATGYGLRATGYGHGHGPRATGHGTLC